jgi:Ca-activated chloride channel homolog
VKAWRVVAVLLAVVLTVGASERAKVKALPEKWRVWLEEEVYPLITGEQRKAFLDLATDAEREEFADRLWNLWGQQSGMGVAFRREYEERLEECRSEFQNTVEDRARALLLHGPPDARKKVDCQQIFYPLDIWQWSYLEGVGQNVTIIFYQPYGLGQYRLWDPFETVWALYTTQGQDAVKQWSAGSESAFLAARPENECGDGQEILNLIGMAEYWLKDPAVKATFDHLAEPASQGVESASARFLKFTTLLPKGAEPLPFDLKTSIGKRRGSKVRVSFTALVPQQGLATTKVGDTKVVQLDVTGEISRADEMADRFRYAFTFPTGADSFPVVIERELRPGRYHVRLKIDDSNSKHAGVEEIDLDVPVPVLPPLNTAEQANVDRAVREAVKGPEDVLSLVGPEGESVSGVQQFTALTRPEVARVEFFLDGKPVLTKNRPPFEVELDLGPLPRLASVAAVAYDATGSELDRKQIDLNVGRERFHVRLQPISPADRVGDKVRVSLTVNVPPDHTLDRVEVYWNDTREATLYAPPFDALVPVPKENEFGYMRALAVLKDGGQAEDLQFINAPQFMSGVQVDAVELPVVVLDRSKHPVEGLKESDFKVVENGAPQRITYFSLQQDLPVRMGILVDTSGSMEKTLPEVQRVVLGFLRTLLRPKDRAFVIAFSDRPTLLEGFTADMGRLERALLALRADRTTAFFDAAVYGLFQFSGVHGRRAMVVLTDGKDNASRLTFDQLLKYAERSGVTIYTIGVDIPITEVRTRYFLSKLARTTGGAAFFLPRNARLDPIYAQIDRELRTQYLIAYTSDSTAPTDQFREVKVHVDRPGTDVRTISGYFPNR